MRDVVFASIFPGGSVLFLARCAVRTCRCPGRGGFRRAFAKKGRRLCAVGRLLLGCGMEVADDSTCSLPRRLRRVGFCRREPWEFSGVRAVSSFSIMWGKFGRRLDIRLAILTPSRAVAGLSGRVRSLSSAALRPLAPSLWVCEGAQRASAPPLCPCSDPSFAFSLRMFRVRVVLEPPSLSFYRLGPSSRARPSASASCSPPRLRFRPVKFWCAPCGFAGESFARRF